MRLEFIPVFLQVEVLFDRSIKKPVYVNKCGRKLCLQPFFAGLGYYVFIVVFLTRVKKNCFLFWPVSLTLYAFKFLNRDHKVRFC